MKLRWSARAEQDLYEIEDFIAADDPSAAARWIDRLRVRVKNVARAPRTGRKVPELDRDDIREVLVGAYRIVYRIEASVVVVLTVFEGHQLPVRIDD